MAFWGIEVKPGKPYSHLYDKARGRLRISQGTLGNGNSTGKSVLQCNVGNKSPVLLCNLIPNSSETCHLELEFEEDDEVIFSVLGQRSVHLSGYFIRSGHGTGGDETDSYGEDISESDTGKSGSTDSFDTEDEYESDFIDDGDIDMFHHTPEFKSSVVIEEIFDDEKPVSGNTSRRRLKKGHYVIDSDDDKVDYEKEKPASGNTSRRRLKKGHYVSDSDDDKVDYEKQIVKGTRSVLFESEDEDGFPISFTVRKEIDAKNAHGNTRSDDKEAVGDKKRKVSATGQDSESSIKPESGTASNGKPKKKKKDQNRKPVETAPISLADEMVSAEQSQAPEGGEKVDVLNGDEVQAKADKNDAGIDMDVVENDGRPKKKKKERVKKGKTAEVAAVHSAGRREGKSNEDSSKTLNNGIADENLHSSVEELEKLFSDDKYAVDNSLCQSSGVLKKKKKRRQNDKNQEGKLDDVDDPELQDSKEIEIDGDLLETQQPNDMSGDVNAEPVAAASINHQDTKKKKKKKKSKKSAKDSNTIAAEKETNLVDEQKHGKRQREFSNGLTIEDLSMGKPDGERAFPGNKVFVNYIGKLKNGEIFDSNVGKRPFSFRLGIGAVIKGWDVGVNGMRVGDKRRLMIPPSMGYGEKGAGKIPGNSWLDFEVELVGVKSKS